MWRYKHAGHDTALAAIYGVAVAPVVLKLSLALILLSFANLNALGATGKFLSGDQFAPMLTWVAERPGAVFEYLSPGALVKLALMLVLVAGPPAGPSQAGAGGAGCDEPAGPAAGAVAGTLVRRHVNQRFVCAAAMHVCTFV